ncbi:hypothetical protein D3C78_1573610 [compost metagenome]
MMMESPSAASSLMKPCTAALEPMSMPLVGSSRMMTLGWVASHLPITTFCWLPPESVPTGTERAAARRSSREAYLRASANSLAAARNPLREVRVREGNDMFW